jgi:hypothetical protein
MSSEGVMNVFQEGFGFKNKALEICMSTEGMMNVLQ